MSIGLNGRGQFMSEIHPELAAVIKRVKDNEIPTATVRTLLGWFGQRRRGHSNVARIREVLQNNEIRTEPDFESVWVDAEIQFTSVPAKSGTVAQGSSQVGGTISSGSAGSTNTSGQTVGTSNSSSDSYTKSVEAPNTPIRESYVKVGHLKAANRAPLRIARDKTINEATTILMLHGYSQLPVMNGERTVLGMLSWRTIGMAYSLGKDPKQVKDAFDPNVHTVKLSDSFHDLVEAIARFDAVLVKNEKQEICGIVTAEDIALHFRELSEPFLLIGEIERSLRRLIGEKLDLAALQAIKNPADTQRVISSIDDLSFGEYVRIMESPSHWSKLDLKADQSSVLERLRAINILRNDVMHFDPDGIEDGDLEDLRRTSIFLQMFVR